MFCECIEWCWWSFTHSHCCHRLLLISSSSPIPIKFSCSMECWYERAGRTFPHARTSSPEKFHLVASQSTDFVSGATTMKVETRKVIKTWSGFIDFAHPLYRLIEFLLVVTQFFCNTLKVGTSHSTQLDDTLSKGLSWVVHPLSHHRSILVINIFCCFIIFIVQCNGCQPHPFSISNFMALTCLTSIIKLNVPRKSLKVVGQFRV